MGKRWLMLPCRLLAAAVSSGVAARRCVSVGEIGDACIRTRNLPTPFGCLRCRVITSKSALSEYYFQTVPSRAFSDNPSPSAVSAASASIASLKSAAIAPPSDVAPFLTAVPTEVAAAITNPAIIASLISDFVTAVPGWYTALPPAAQSYIVNVGPKVLELQPELASLQAIIDAQTTTGAGVITATITGNLTRTVFPTAQTGFSGGNFTRGTSTSVLYVNSTGSSASRTSESSSSSTITSLSSSAAAASASSTSTSSAGAAKQTAVLAAGCLGAMGVFGFALAL